MHQKAPQLWTWLTKRWLGLDDGLSWCWWLALHKAQWSHAVDLRRAIVHFETRPAHAQTPDDVLQFITRHVSPPVVVALLDELVREGHLLKRDAVRLEEAVLAQVTRHGGWK